MTLYEARFDDKPTVIEEANTAQEFADKHPGARLYAPVAVHNQEIQHPNDAIYGK